MRLLRILLVDDEPHVLRSMSKTLKAHMEWDLELYTASSGEDAINILNDKRIDLMITDIQMPGITGLRLADLAREHWPECKTLILSAYDNFSYAREAINASVFGYMLKSDGDEAIIYQCTKAALAIGAQYGKLELLARSPSAASDFGATQLFFDFLNGRYKTKDEVSEVLRSVSLPKAPAWLVVSRSAAADTTRALFVKHFPTVLWARAVFSRDDVCIWVMKEQGEPELESSLSDTLDRLLGESVKEGALTQIAYARFTDITDLPGLYHAWQEILDKRIDVSFACGLRAEDSLQGTLTNQQMPSAVMKYIQDHIGEDLTLNTLGGIFGYNASYLSRLFMEKAGANLSEYIALKKYEEILRLMADETLPLAAIAKRTGFVTRSYFNRFVKKHSGKTPQELRRHLLTRQSACAKGSADGKTHNDRKG